MKTFIVSNIGIVCQKDLGPSTLDQFHLMERYNPDKAWTPVEENGRPFARDQHAEKDRQTRWSPATRPFHKGPKIHGMTGSRLLH